MAIRHKGTIELTGKKVGAGCDNDESDVETVQQLLQAAGFLTAEGAKGGWGPACQSAFESFRTRHGTGAQCAAKHLEPNDELLLVMAQEASILLPLSGFRGMAGVKEMHRWLRDNRIQYNQGAQRGEGNRAVWGVHGNTAFAVQSTGVRYLNGHFRDVKFAAGPVEMDCTLYVNLMLSLYFTGHLHTGMYEASTPFGAIAPKHLARDRYGLPLVWRRTATQPVNWFRTAAEIADATKASPTSVYVLEVAGGAEGGVTHMALMSGSTVYECTTGQVGSSCINRSLEQFMGKGKNVYLFGPK